MLKINNLEIIFFISFFLLLLGNFSAFGEPYLLDPNFAMEEYVSGIRYPTSMAFIENDLIVLEKGGNVQLVQDGILQTEPILQLDVLNNAESGLLGITIKDSLVYLFLTERDSNSDKVFGNRIYKYEWNNEKLVNPILVKEFPVESDHTAASHSGGAMAVNSDGEVFAVMGDAEKRGLLQNLDEGTYDDTSVVVHVNLDEEVLKPSLTANPTEHYYAIGIRNSFGLAVDPHTDFLWATENGPYRHDEINLVEPKSNSGWMKITGPSTEKQLKELPSSDKFHYSDPEFSWYDPVALTDLTFVNSDSFSDYDDYLFVGDWKTGSIYKLKLNSDRTGFVFDDPSFNDLVYNTEDKFEEIIFGSGFAGISSLEFGPDGFLYALSIGTGTVYKIYPISDDVTKEFVLPNWIKDNAEWWSSDQITDDDFSSGIEYLINEGIIVIPPTVMDSEKSDEIPGWVKFNAGWWAEGQITANEFVSGIQYLVSIGIISINYDKCDALPSIRVNLSDCELSRIELSNTDLKQANFHNANLANANFSNTDLRNVNYNAATLTGTDFTNTKMNMASFVDANLKNSKLKNAILHYAQLEGAVISDSDLSESKLDYSNMKNTKLTNSDLSKTSLSFAVLNNSDLENAILSDSYMFRARLQDSNLKGSDLSNSKLEHTELQKAILSNANLSNANFRQANLTNAIINNGYVVGAEMKTAKIFSTDLSGSNLSNVNFHRAGVVASNLSLTDLTNANFTKAWVTRSNFTDAILTNTDFTNAILTGTDFSGTNLQDALGSPFIGCKGHPACT